MGNSRQPACYFASVPTRRLSGKNSWATFHFSDRYELISQMYDGRGIPNFIYYYWWNTYKSTLIHFNQLPLYKCASTIQETLEWSWRMIVDCGNCNFDWLWSLDNTFQIVKLCGKAINDNLMLFANNHNLLSYYQKPVTPWTVCWNIVPET